MTNNIGVPQETYGLQPIKIAKIKESDLKILKNLKDFFLIKNAIALSFNENQTNILVKMNIPENSLLREVIKSKISHLIPVELQENTNFVWGESQANNFIPMFDLVLKRSDINSIKMSEESINLFTPYIPMKPTKTAFYDLNKILEVLA